MKLFGLNVPRGRQILLGKSLTPCFAGVLRKSKVKAPTAAFFGVEVKCKVRSPSAVVIIINIADTRNNGRKFQDLPTLSLVWSSIHQHILSSSRNDVSFYHPPTHSFLDDADQHNMLLGSTSHFEKSPQENRRFEFIDQMWIIDFDCVSICIIFHVHNMGFIMCRLPKAMRKQRAMLLSVASKQKKSSPTRSGQVNSLNIESETFTT